MRLTSIGLLLGLVLGCSACTRSVAIPNNDTRALLAALHAANASPGSDEIRLARRGLYVFTGADSAGLVLPVVRGKLRIAGNGAEIRSYSNLPVALLEIAPDGELSIDALSLAEGSHGAIRNFGKLRLEGARVLDSTGRNAAAIITNHGQLIARDSEFAYNQLDASQRDAGTILNYGELDLRNTSIHDNSVQRAHAGLAVAGSVLNLGLLRSSETRIENNQADHDLADDLIDASAQQARVFAGVLNIGNGRAEGDLGAALVRDAGL